MVTLDIKTVVKDFMDVYKSRSVPKILTKLADLLGTVVKDGRVEIPERFGKGYCCGFVFNDQIRMMITHYDLKEDLVLQNPDVVMQSRMILFKFQNVTAVDNTVLKDKRLRAVPSVLIATSSMHTDVVIPVDRHTATINIEVSADYLKDLFDLSDGSPVLKGLLENAQPLLFEQMVYPSLLQIAYEIVSEPVDKAFELFFLRIKAEELVCKMLIELKKREGMKLYALNVSDIKAIYAVKVKMLEDLGRPPVIKELAVFANMSPTKLKHLFKQVFGNSIFSYYQEHRMRAAAVLLKEERFSVAEVGYQMGFTNLSHFSRVFKVHMGMRPKEYSMS